MLNLKYLRILVSMSKICFGNNNKIIVSFAGLGCGTGNLYQYEFVNFLEKNFNNYERHFYFHKLELDQSK